MNPSYEYMRRIRLEEHAKLLDMRRERVVKALDGLTLHGDANAMLTQIAYSIHPHVGAWDAESCDHLRNVIAELIGEAREAASGAQHACSCGVDCCDCGDESAEVDGGMAGGGCGMREVGGVGALGRMDYSDVHQGDVGYPLTQYDVLGNERHKAVCELRKLTSGIDDLNSYYQFVGELFDALGVDDCPDDELCWDDRLISLCDRLIHLLGGDQSHDTSSMRQENETENLRMELAELEMERDEYRKEMVGAYKTAATFYEERRMYFDLLRDAARDYKTLDQMSAETSANFHAMRDRVWGLEAERDELQARLDELGTQNGMLRDKLDELSTSGATELYKLLKRTVGDAKQIADKLNAHNGMLKESERLRYENARCAAVAVNKACMYLDLLRDAAGEYKALQDKLNHVVEVCQSYAEANA